MSICILIVDDDRLVVEKLAKGIGWERIGIESVLTANNVRQAMKILEEAPVDILLSDIEMPQGSGLELLEWVRGRDLPVECVFLSSYAYFAYAQKAINLKSSNYLLKPVSNSEMEEVLAALVKDIRGRRQVLEKEDRKEKRHLFWKTYLLQETWNGAWLERARQEGIYNPERRVCLHLLRIFPGVEQKTRDVTLNHFIVRNVTEEFFEREESAGRLEAVVRRCDSEWFLIFEAGGMGEAVSAYRQCLERTLSMRICIYIGRDCPEAELHERRKYLEWIEQEAVPGDDGLVRESEWVKKDVKALTAPWKEWEQEMVDADTVREVEKKVLAFIRRLWEDHQVTVSVLERFRKEMMQMIYRYFDRQDLLIARVFDGREFDGYYEKSVMTLPDMEAFIRYIWDKAAGLCRLDNRQENVVERMKRYIEDHLKEDLSRKTLAGMVFLSEDYISKLFMSTTGTSIPSYVASCRMQKAQEYLRHSGMAVSRIAMEVGDSNFSYFSKTFRDYTGCTPGEYRSRIQKNGGG